MPAYFFRWQTAANPLPCKKKRLLKKISQKQKLTTKKKAEGKADEDEFYVPIMTEVDGIKIPRLQTKSKTLSITGELPADVGNKAAKGNPSKPVTGGGLIVRFNSEPGRLNPITESSAVQSYISEYVNQALARQNPETLEYEPALAKSWTVEDSVKLAPNYPGKERRLIEGNKEPASTVVISYTALTSKEKKLKGEEKKEPQKITLTTTNKEGKPLANIWVGLFVAKGNKIPGFPVTGEHYWSDDTGQLVLSGLKTGKYQVHVGAEITGKATENKDGSLTVKPLTQNNPLNKEVATSKEKSLTLPKKDWFNVQRETIYTYDIDENAKWSDGTPFTSKDLEFTYAILQNDFVDGDSLKIYYKNVISCEGLTPHSVRIRYRQQYFKSFEFTMGLAFYAAPFHKFQEYIKQEFKRELTIEQLTEKQEKQQNKTSVYGQQFGKYFNTNNTYNVKPLGTGPYVVKSWLRNDSIIIKRNPDYWGKDRRGYLDNITFKFIPDSSTAMQALKSGEIDFFWAMTPPQYYETLEGPPEWFAKKYVKASWFSPGFSYAGWNMLKPKFKDRRVRIALALLIDVNKFVEKKLHGDAVLVSGSQYQFGVAYDHAVKPIGYDADVANQLLAEAGWIDTDNDGVLDKDGEKFVFEYLYPPGSKVAEDQTAVIQKVYKSAGIVMIPRKLEWASFIEKVMAKDFDVCRLGWGSSIESDPFQIWHGSEAGKDKRGSNHVSFSNAQADKLIEKLRYTLDLKERQKIHFAFHRILDREQPYLFLYTSKMYGAYNQKFRGVKWYRLRPGFDFYRMVHSQRPAIE